MIFVLLGVSLFFFFISGGQTSLVFASLGWWSHTDRASTLIRMELGQFYATYFLFIFVKVFFYYVYNFIVTRKTP